MTTEGNANAANVFIQDPALFDVLTWTGSNWTNYPSSGLIPGYATVSNTGFGLSIPASDVGTNNVWLGYQAGGATVSTGNNNVVLGAAASLGLSTTSQNVVIGSLASNTSGSDAQTVIGYDATNESTGNQDIVIGAYAKLTGQVGPANTASTVLIGSGSQHQGAGQTVIVGSNSGYLSNTDADNVYVGYRVGQKVAGSATVLGGNTLVGSRVDGVTGLFPQLSRTSAFGAYTQLGSSLQTYTTVCGASNNVLSDRTCLLGANTSVAGTTPACVVLGNGLTVTESNTFWLGGFDSVWGTGDSLKVQTACGVGSATGLPGPPQGYVKTYINGSGPYVIPFWPA